MRLVLTPRRHAVPMRPDERPPTPEENLARVAEARRQMVLGLQRRFPQVRILGIEGKSEILVELPDSEPHLPHAIRAALDVESGPVRDDPLMPVWRDIPPVLESVESSYRDRQYRPTVVAIVRDAEGRILLVQAARDGEWGVVQGGIEEGEPPLVALGRELGEEVSIGPERFVATRFIGCADIAAAPGSADRMRFVAGVRYFVFEVAYRGSGELVLQKEELSGYAWVGPRFDDPDFLEKLAGTRPAKCRLILASLVRIL